MTITVEAGITSAALRSAKKVLLPIDVPPRGDVRRAGGQRQWATPPAGARATTSSYHIVNTKARHRAGGRVVKNVATDLCKLHIGALGALGIIARVTLKLRPLPESRGVVGFACATDDLVPVLEIIHRSQTRPICVEVLNARAAAALNPPGGAVEPGRWAVLVGFEQNEQAVAWQVSELIERELPGELQKSAQAWKGEQADKVLADLGELCHRPEDSLAFKANLLPHGVAAFCRKAASLADRVRLQAHAGNGIILGNIDGELSREEAQSLLLKLREEASAASGNLVIRRCPAAWKASLPVWGAVRGDLPLMKEIKRRLDPKQLFNPGRLFSIE